MWQIFTFGNGDVIAAVITGLKVMMTTGAYESLFRLGLLGLVIFALLHVTFNRRFLGPMLIGAVGLLYASVFVTADVSIEDQVNAAVPDTIVTGVPVLIAFPAYVSGQVGYHLTSITETALLLPTGYRSTGSVINRPLFETQKLLDFTLPDSDLWKNLVQYLMNCTLKEIDYNQLNRTAVEKATDALGAIAATNPALSSPWYQNGNIQPAAQLCTDFHANVITPGFTTPALEYLEATQKLRSSLGADPATPGDELPLIDQLRTTLLGVPGQTSDQVLRNIVIVKAWKEAWAQRAKTMNDVPSAVKLAQEATTQDLKYQAYTKSYIAAKFLPVLRTVAEGLVYLVTPFIAVMALSGSMTRVLGLYGRSFAWLAMWGPLYAVVNFVMYFEANAKLKDLVINSGFADAITFNSFDPIREYIVGINSMAADLTLAVPAVAWGLVWAGGNLASSLTGSLSAPLSAAGQEAGQFARGQGQVMSEAPSYVMEPVRMGTAGRPGSQESYTVPVGLGGLRVDAQTGVSTLHHADGGTTRIGANGMVTYQGPTGGFSRRASEQSPTGAWYESGAFRREEFDHAAGRTVEKQFEVRGATIDKSFSYERDGILHSVREEYNQETGKTVRRVDASIKDGVSRVETSTQWGPQQVSETGPVMAWAVHPDGRQEPVTGTLSRSGLRLGQEDFWGEGQLVTSGDGPTREYKGRLTGQKINGISVFAVSQGGYKEGVVGEVLKEDANLRYYHSADGGTFYTREAAESIDVRKLDGEMETIQGKAREFGRVTVGSDGKFQHSPLTYEIESTKGDRKAAYSGEIHVDAEGKKFLQATAGGTERSNKDRFVDAGMEYVYKTGDNGGKSYTGEGVRLQRIIGLLPENEAVTRQVATHEEGNVIQLSNGRELRVPTSVSLSYSIPGGVTKSLTGNYDHQGDFHIAAGQSREGVEFLTLDQYGGQEVAVRGVRSNQTGEAIFSHAEGGQKTELWDYVSHVMGWQEKEQYLKDKPIEWKDGTTGQTHKGHFFGLFDKEGNLLEGSVVNDLRSQAFVMKQNPLTQEYETGFIDMHQDPASHASVATYRTLSTEQIGADGAARTLTLGPQSGDGTREILSDIGTGGRKTDLFHDYTHETGGHFVERFEEFHRTQGGTLSEMHNTRMFSGTKWIPDPVHQAQHHPVQMRGFMDEQGNVVYAEFQSGQYGKTWNYKVVDGKAQWGVADTAQPTYGGPGLTNFRSLSTNEVETSGLASTQVIGPDGKLLYEKGDSGIQVIEWDVYRQELHRRVNIGAEYPVFGHWDAKEFTNEDSGAKQTLRAIGAGKTAIDIVTGAGNLAMTGRRLGGVFGGGSGAAGPKGGPLPGGNPTGRPGIQPGPGTSPQSMEDLQRFQEDLTHALKKSGIDITGAKGAGKHIQP